MKNVSRTQDSPQHPATIILPGLPHKLLVTAIPVVNCKINYCSLALNCLDAQGSIQMEEANQVTDFTGRTSTSCPC